VEKSGKYRMTLGTNQKLEQLFDLPRDEEETTDVSAPDPDVESNLPVNQDTLDTLSKIEQALPAVRGLEASDEEMDALAKKASESFDDLMDLGMQVDSRYASEIFAVAGAMLGHAITAKTAKLNKKLKMIDLQLKQAKLVKDTTKSDADDNIQTAEGRVLDRNDLLKTLLQRDEKPTGDK
jgi:hypothetical protein